MMLETIDDNLVAWLNESGHVRWQELYPNVWESDNSFFGMDWTVVNEEKNAATFFFHALVKISKMTLFIHTFLEWL